MTEVHKYSLTRVDQSAPLDIPWQDIMPNLMEQLHQRDYFEKMVEKYFDDGQDWTLDKLIDELQQLDYRGVCMGTLDPNARNLRRNAPANIIVRTRRTQRLPYQRNRGRRDGHQGGSARSCGGRT